MATHAVPLTDDTARLRLLDAIAAGKGQALTVPDLVARTALSPPETERLLRGLVLEYESELDVDDDGNLLYRFSPSMKAREDVVDADRRRRRRQALGKLAVRAFKVWTVAMVIVYFIVYVCLLIAFLVAISANSEGEGSNGRSSSRRRSGGGGWIFWMGRGGLWPRGRRRSRKAARQRAKEAERTVTRRDPYTVDGAGPTEEEAKPGLVDRTWYYLFGETDVRTPLEEEKELLTYLRAKKGLITNADIMALLGLTWEEADKVGTRLVASYEGELDITDDGVAVYRFPNLMISGAPEVAEQTPRLGYLWHVRRSLVALRKAPKIVIPALNAFNLVLAFFTATTILPYFGWTTPLAMFLLVALPGTYSVLFFVVAFRRWLRDRRGAEQFERDNIRISLYRLLLAGRHVVRVPADARAIAAAGLGSWGEQDLVRHLPAIAEEIRGQVTREPDGSVTLHATRMAKEVRVVDGLRRTTASIRPVGRTVFSSRIEDAESGPALESDALAGEIAALANTERV